MFKAIRRLWLFATCTHINKCVNLSFPSSDEFIFCQACGRLLYTMNDNDRRHNKHKRYPVLDYTKKERDLMLAEENEDA